jgi:ubiquinone/menaquinone biosynthesis C-methylase UbiE
MISYIGTEVGTQNQSNREKWLERTLAALPSGQRILDAGAGELQYKRFCEHLEYVGQDFGRYQAGGDGAGLQMDCWDQSQLNIVSDITDIPEPDSSFDAVMCIEVLEHVPDPIRALRELTRLLRFGGTLIVTAPFCSLTHFSPHFYHTGYSRYFYEHWLRELGYDIVDMQWNGSYFDYLAQELRRVNWAGNQYAKSSPTLLERSAIGVVLRCLNRLSKKDNGSEQLLSFGLHVVATKQS